MAQTREHVLLSAFAGLEAAHFFSAFLPSYMTIQRFGGDPQSLKALRAGELFALLFAVLLGLVVSALIEDPLPMYFTIGVSGLMLIVYESAIRQRGAP